MAEHNTALPKQWMDRAQMMTEHEYEKTCVSRVTVNPAGRVFDAIKKA
ncbi:hypothetical protein [Paenibacillus sp. Soil724D2]|nr:hypothetical protein [Paenibacillus sp. Soil724D2]